MAKPNQNDSVLRHIQLVSDVFTHSSLWEIGYNSMMDCDNLILSFADETIDV